METPLVKRKARADARRNRARLLQVAEDVFATRGVAASTEDIAAAAGVGIGTLFRHFPTKEALLQEVFRERLRRVAEQAERLAASEEVDAGEAFFAFFEQAVDQSRGKTAIADALAAVGIDLDRSAGDMKPYVRSALERLLSRAQAEGAVRRDIGLPELLALLLAASRAVEHVGEDRALARRAVAIILDGLAPSPADRRRRTSQRETP